MRLKNLKVSMLSSYIYIRIFILNSIYYIYFLAKIIVFLTKKNSKLYF